MVDAVESFRIVYGDGCGSQGRFLLVESFGYGCGKWKEGGHGRVHWLEAVLSGVRGESAGQEWQDQSFQNFARGAEERDGSV